MLRDEEATEIRGVLDTPYSAADLSTMIDNHMPYFEDLWERGRENELYMKGENLSDGKGLAFYEFNDVKDEQEFKQNYKKALDSLAFIWFS